MKKLKMKNKEKGWMKDSCQYTARLEEAMATLKMNGVCRHLPRQDKA